MYTFLKRLQAGITIEMLICGVVLLPSITMAASISSQGCLGVSDFSCVSDGEFNSGPLSQSRAEHDGTLIPTSGDFVGTVSGHSDIGAGTLRAQGAVSSNPGDPASVGLDGGVIFGNASLNDDVSFTNTLTGPLDVTINMYVSGYINTGGGEVSVSSFLNLGGETDFGSYSDDGPISDVLTATITLTNSDPINIGASLGYNVDTYPGNAAITNLDVSAYLELIIEDEVIFVSESTHFLTTPVPVPPALPMLLGGIASLISLSRRRKRF